MSSDLVELLKQKTKTLIEIARDVEFNWDNSDKWVRLETAVADKKQAIQKEVSDSIREQQTLFLNYEKELKEQIKTLEECLAKQQCREEAQKQRLRTILRIDNDVKKNTYNDFEIDKLISEVFGEEKV